MNKDENFLFDREKGKITKFGRESLNISKICPESHNIPSCARVDQSIRTLVEKLENRSDMLKT